MFIKLYPFIESLIGALDQEDPRKTRGAGRSPGNVRMAPSQATSVQEHGPQRKTGTSVLLGHSISYPFRPSLIPAASQFFQTLFYFKPWFMPQDTFFKKVAIVKICKLSSTKRGQCVTWKWGELQNVQNRKMWVINVFLAQWKHDTYTHLCLWAFHYFGP